MPGNRNSVQLKNYFAKPGRITTDLIRYPIIIQIEGINIAKIKNSFPFLYLDRLNFLTLVTLIYSLLNLIFQRVLISQESLLTF